MKYIDLHSWPGLKPDEKEFKESIITLLCDHFSHEDLNLVYAHSSAQELPCYGKNVIVFLSGNERSETPVFYNKVGLIFTDFWNPSMPSNMHHIPLGLNERTSGRFVLNLSMTRLTSRAFDIGFIGSSHSSHPNTHRVRMLESLQKLDPLIKKSVSTYNGFFFNNTDTGCSDKALKYIKQLHEIKISLCPGGCMAEGDAKYFPGWESYRFYESLLAGNIIITNNNWSKWYKGPNIFYIDHWSNLTTDFVRNILNKNIDQIQSDGINYFKSTLSRFNILKDLIITIDAHINLIKSI